MTHHKRFPDQPGAILPPTVTLDVVCQWSTEILTDTTPRCLAQVVKNDEGKWRLQVAIVGMAKQPDGQVAPVKMISEYPLAFLDRSPTPEDVQANGGQPIWGLLKLGPTVWKPSPGVPVQQGMRAHLTIVGVPEPAPWESSLILVP